MPSGGFETAIPATMRPQTALDRAATGIGLDSIMVQFIVFELVAARHWLFYVSAVRYDSGNWTMRLLATDYYVFQCP
jgi:hypothetical protein